MLNTQRPKTPIQVAQIVFSLEPGGMENGVVNIANNLDKSEFKTHVVCLEHEGQFANRLSELVTCTALARLPGWDWGACRRLNRLLLARRPDILHTHNLGPLIYAVSARAMSPSLWTIPIVHGEHGVLQGDSLSPKRIQQRKALYRLCRHIHTVSESMRTHLASLQLPSSKIVSILNGVDTNRFCPPDDKAVARCAIGLPASAFVFGCVGRHIPTKRHDLLLDAFRILGQRYPDAHLLMLGDGGSEKASLLKQIETSGLGSRIHWRGHVPDPVPFYQAMDLLVMPSSHEGLANALLEAMATAVPALSHDACGANEVITPGVTGFLETINSDSELANHLMALLSDKGRLISVGRAAREAALERFSLDKMVENYAGLYRACLS